MTTTARKAKSVKIHSEYADQFGECFHTALRKGCDSDATSAMWNAIHVVPNGTMTPYYDAMKAVLTNGKKYQTVDEFVSDMRDAWQSAEKWGDSSRALIQCLAKMFSDRDWRGALGYFYEASY
jgi:hypothetical protein